MINDFKDQHVDTGAELTQETASSFANEFVKVADLDGDGQIDFTEFKAFMQKVDQSKGEEILQGIFE